MKPDCCGACLTRGRRLDALGAGRAARVLRAAEKSADSLALAQVCVCWECRALVDKSVVFSERVRRAQALLLEENLAALADNENNEESMSTLVRVTKAGYDFVYQHSDVKFKSIENFDEPKSINSREPSVSTQDSHETDSQSDVSMSPSYFSDFKDQIDEDSIREPVDDIKIAKVKVDAIKGVVGPKLKDGFSIVMRDLTQKSQKFKNNKITYLDPPIVSIKRIKGDETEELKSIKPSDFKAKVSTLIKDKKKSKSTVKSLTRSELTIQLKTEVDQCRKKPPKIRTVFMTEEEMQKGRAEDRKNEQYISSLLKCETCIVGFMNEAFLDDHNKSKHSPELGPYACDICGLRLPRADNVKWHRRSHYHLYVCVCGYAHRLMSDVSRHYISQHEPDRTYACLQCGQQFQKQRQLRYHKEKEHFTMKTCSQCGESFVCRASYLRHLEVHADSTEYSCALCCKLVRGKALLRAHMRAHAPQTDELAFCAECNLQFKNKNLYRAHLRNSLKHVSRDDLKHLCDKCDIRFASPGELRRHHDLVHLQKELYKCTQCGKNYSSRQGLVQHRLKIHEGVKPEKNKFCELCGKAFSTSGILATHRRIHTGERPLKCPMCETTFRQSGALYKHCELIHGKKPRSAQ